MKAPATPGAFAERLLTVEEAARYLRVIPRSVRRYVASGALPALRVGHGPRAQFRIAPSALDELLRPVGEREGA